MYETLSFGGILRHMWTWSETKCPSKSSMFIYLQRSFNISPTCRLNFPYSFFFLYFCTNSTWYLQSHRTWDRFSQSYIGSSSSALRGFPWGWTYIISHRIGRTSLGASTRGRGLLHGFIKQLERVFKKFLVYSQIIWTFKNCLSCINCCILLSD